MTERASARGYTEGVLLQGLFVPLTCPFYRDGASYLRKLEYNVGRYSLGPAAGMLVLPPAGEGLGLTDVEVQDALASVAGSAGKAKVLLAGIERSSVAAALALAEIAERMRFDAVVLAPPPDWTLLVKGQDARELLTFFRSVADHAALPVVLWSGGGSASLQLPVELLAVMAQHRNVIGLIDGHLTPERLAQIQAATVGVEREVTVTTVFEAVTRRMREPVNLEAVPALVSVESLVGGNSAPPVSQTSVPALKTRTRTVGFQVIGGGPAGGIVPLLAAGAAGVLPPLAACAPQGCFEAYAAWKDGDQALAKERAARFGEIDRLLAELGPAAVKAGCDFNGYFGGMPRLPRLPLPSARRAEVEQALRLLRN